MAKILISMDIHNILYSSLSHSCLTNINILNDRKGISNKLIGELLLYILFNNNINMAGIR